MKLSLTFLVLLIAAPSALAQWIVHDPANTAVSSAIHAAQASSHVETLHQWANQLEKLNRQIRQLEEQLIEQRRIREVLGDPTLAGSQMVMDKLGPEELARSYGDTLRAMRRLTDATASLRRTAEGIYGELGDSTILNQSFTRQIAPYLRYAAVDQRAESLGRVHDQTQERRAALQADLAQSLGALQSAPTQAEVDKLNVKVAALNGQLALVAAERREESDKLQAQQIENENQAAKERQDLIERQIAEERQTLEVVNAWQRAVRITPASYTR